MFPHRGNIADLCNSLFPMGLRNTETRYFVLCQCNITENWKKGKLNSRTATEAKSDSKITIINKLRIYGTQNEKCKIRK